jgi:hypothetical protein
MKQNIISRHFNGIEYMELYIVRILYHGFLVLSIAPATLTSINARVGINQPLPDETRIAARYTTPAMLTVPTFLIYIFRQQILVPQLPPSHLKILAVPHCCTEIHLR